MGKLLLCYLLNTRSIGERGGRLVAMWLSYSCQSMELVIVSQSSLRLYLLILSLREQAIAETPHDCLLLFGCSLHGHAGKNAREAQRDDSKQAM
jgi:hypothetical protein